MCCVKCSAKDQSREVLSQTGGQGKARRHLSGDLNPEDKQPVRAEQHCSSGSSGHKDLWEEGVRLVCQRSRAQTWVASRPGHKLKAIAI